MEKLGFPYKDTKNFAGHISVIKVWDGERYLLVTGLFFSGKL
jgi:hypothetical protein